MSKRIFIGLFEIAGYYENLAKGLRDLGYDVTFAGSGTHKFNYQTEKVKQNFIVDLFNYCLKQKIHTSRTNFVIKVSWAIFVELLKIPLFVWALFRCEVFIFSFGLTFSFNHYDLFFLKLFKKKIICNIGHGADARPSYIDGVNLNRFGQHLSAKENYNKSRVKRKRLRVLEEYADTIISSPFTGHFLQKSFVNGYYLGLPLTAPGLSSLPTKTDSKFKIIHAPSNPYVKGSALIKETVFRLIDEGYEIEYIELVGRPNKEVLEAISSCDLVIDQLYSDTALAGLATEAAWLKKTSIVGGYAWNELKQLFPSEKIPPSIICHPSDFAKTLKDAVINKDQLVTKGEESYNFVKNNWSIKMVANSYQMMIEKLIPNDWYFDPSQIEYVQGAGLNEIILSDNINALIKEYGIKGLCLEHNPALEVLFLNFSKRIFS